MPAGIQVAGVVPNPGFGVVALDGRQGAETGGHQADQAKQDQFFAHVGPPSGDAPLSRLTECRFIGKGSSLGVDAARRDASDQR